MEVWEIAIIVVGSIAACVLVAAILTCCCLWKRWKQKIKVRRTVSHSLGPLRNNDYDVEAQRETNNIEGSDVSASRNSNTSNHSQPSHIQQSRPNSVAPGIMPFSQPSHIQQSRPNSVAPEIMLFSQPSHIQQSRPIPLALDSGTMPFSQPSHIQQSRPKPLASNSETIPFVQPSYIQQSRTKPIPSISGTLPFENAVQSNHPNVNHYYQDETMRNKHINSRGNQPPRSSSNKHKQNLSRQSGTTSSGTTSSGTTSSGTTSSGTTSSGTTSSGTTSSDTRFPVSVMKPSQQEIDINSRVKFTKYAELDLHFLRLNEAMPLFKFFLSKSIDEYENSNRSKQKRVIEVITGRGKHSPNGIPVIKPAVESYLIKHQYKNPKKNIQPTQNWCCQSFHHERYNKEEI